MTQNLLFYIDSPVMLHSQQDNSNNFDEIISDISDDIYEEEIINQNNFTISDNVPKSLEVFCKNNQNCNKPIKKSI